MAGPEGDGQNQDPGIRLVLEELRDLRLEMRADRQYASEEKRRADEERRRTDEEWRLERRQADEQWRQEKLQSDERFQQLMRQLTRDFREDSARREATTQKAFKDIRAVGLSIVKTLNHHTRILERIERNLGTGGRRRPGQGNGRGT